MDCFSVGHSFDDGEQHYRETDIRASISTLGAYLFVIVSLSECTTAISKLLISNCPLNGLQFGY